MRSPKQRLCTKQWLNGPTATPSLLHTAFSAVLSLQPRTVGAVVPQLPPLPPCAGVHSAVPTQATAVPHCCLGTAAFSPSDLLGAALGAGAVSNRHRDRQRPHDGHVSSAHRHDGHRWARLVAASKWQPASGGAASTRAKRCIGQHIYPESEGGCRCCRFASSLRLFPQLRSVKLRAAPYCGLLFDPWPATRLPELRELSLTGLGLDIGGGGPAFTALTGLAVRGALAVSLAARLPALQRLTLNENHRARLAGPGLALPALSCLNLFGGDDGVSTELDFGAMPALRELDLDIDSLPHTHFGAHSVCALTGLTQLRLGTPHPITEMVLATSAPSLRSLDLYIEEDELQCGVLVAALGSLRQLTELSGSHLLLPLLPAGAHAQLHTLHLRSTCSELRCEDIVQLGCLRALRTVMYRWDAEADPAQEEVWLQVRPPGAAQGLRGGAEWGMVSCGSDPSRCGCTSHEQLGHACGPDCSGGPTLHALQVLRKLLPPGCEVSGYRLCQRECCGAAVPV